MFLLTASEVVLGTAIIMGLSAIITVLLRVCSRSSSRENVSTVPDEFGRTGFRVSLTSLQQRIMTKLRDRPPRYETRHNYEYQRREGNTRIAVLNPAAAAATSSPEGSNVPPPAYEVSDITSVRKLNLNFWEIPLKNILLGQRTATRIHDRYRRCWGYLKSFVFE